MKRCYDKKLIIRYSALFFAISFIIFLPFVAKGKGFISLADGYNQMYPTYVYVGTYIRDMIKNLFTGHYYVKTYDFNIGYGEDIITALNIYGFGDIFNLTSVLFPAKLSEIGFLLTLIAKAYASGLTFLAWAFNKTQKSNARLLGALSYVFSGFFLYYGMHFANFMTALVYMPLIVLGAETTLGEKKKASNLFIAAVFLQSLCGFYFIYMETVFIFIYCFFYLINDKDIRNSFISIVRLAYNYLIGIMAAAFILIPEIIAFMHSDRADGIANNSFDAWIIMRPQDFIKAIDGALFAPGYFEGGVGITVVAVFAVISMICNNNPENRLIHRIAIFWMVAYLVPFTGYVMSGFANYGSLRFIFILNFILSGLIVIEFDNIRNLSLKHSIITIFVYLLVGMMVIFNTSHQMTDILRLIYITVFVAFFAIFGLKNEKRFFYFGMLAICLIGVINNFPKAIGGKGWSGMFHNFGVYSEIASSRFSEYSQKIDEEYERTDISESSCGKSYILGKPSADLYLSISNPAISQFVTYYSIGSSVNNSTHNIKGLEGRLIPEMLMSSRYYKVGDEIYRNDYALPLGILFDTYVTDSDNKDRDPLDRTQMLLDTVQVDKDIDGVSRYNWEETDRKWHIVSSKCDYSGEIDETGKIILDGASDIIVSTDEILDDNSEIYLAFNNIDISDDSNLTILVDEKKITVTQTILDKTSGVLLIKLDDILKLSEGIAISFESHGMSKMGMPTIREYNLSYIPERYKELTAGLTSFEYYKNGLVGVAKADENKLLYMSIPYSEGWNAYIDGTRTKIMLANEGFMAIAVNQGTHIIEFKYHTPGMGFGVIISIMAVLIWILKNARLKGTI